MKASKNNLQMLQAAAAYLTRYDKRAFGLLDALKKRDDADAYSQALAEVNQLMSQWLEKQRQGSRPIEREK